MDSFKIMIVMFLFLLWGCKNEQPTENNSDIFGKYESSRFIESGSNDLGVDIQSAGGYLTITLCSNLEFTSELFVPANVNSYFPAGYTNYKGQFSRKDNLVEFNSAEFILQKIYWNKETEQLESFGIQSKGREVKILLNKKSSMKLLALKTDLENIPSCQGRIQPPKNRNKFLPNLYLNPVFLKL